MKILDLFAGAGGMSYGFKMAGFENIGAVEFDVDAANTYKKNVSDKNIFVGDISKISDSDIIKYFSGVNVIAGGPPCQGFSNGNRSHIENDPRNKLFFEFIRFVKLLKPNFFVMENVPGLLSRDNGYAKKTIIKIMEELGYFVECMDLKIKPERCLPESAMQSIRICYEHL